MATHDLSRPELFIDIRDVDGTDHLSTPANYASNEALDTRLLALSYTQAQIDHMTQNDKVYAVRLADDADSI